MTTVINIKTGVAYDVYCGRAGHGQDGYFGNPFRLQAGQVRGSTLSRFTAYFHTRLETDLEYAQRILTLKDRVLGCFCKPAPCHCDIIADYLNSLP